MDNNDNCSYTDVKEFEWDENKRQSNLLKHSVDFEEIESLFDGRPVFTEASTYPEEQGFVTTGEINGRFYTAVWTPRGTAVRLISARRARHEERRAHRSLHGG